MEWISQNDCKCKFVFFDFLITIEIIFFFKLLDIDFSKARFWLGEIFYNFYIC